ncbi:hypothetical protein L7F22_018712 [Adiantum nelumboides]|nr:hypothetical protein [Adiantum nelumboides]
MESSCFRKRKREGEEQFEQSHVVGLQEVSHPAAASIDLHHNSPPPPGWEQCLDLQSGQMYFFNPATQMRVACDPQCNLLRESAAGQDKNGKCYSGMTLGLDLEMKLPSSAASIGMHSLPFRDNGPAVHPRGNASLGSSLNLIGETLSSDISMAATVCLHCHTLVMVSRLSPYCPSCKNLCNVNFLSMSPGSAQA